MKTKLTPTNNPNKIVLTNNTNNTNNINNINNANIVNFIKVPNVLLQHSLQEDKYILPLYLWSVSHSNPYLNNIIDTNLSLLSKTFEGENPSAPRRFNAALNYLTGHTERYTEAELTLPELEPLFTLITTPMTFKISKEARIRYTCLPAKAYNDWTKLTYEEYNYILNLGEENSSKKNSSISAKYNLIELLNLYMYYKSKITKYANYHKKNTEQFAIKESIDSISKNTKLSRNTLTKYTNQLVYLGLIEVKRGKFKNNEGQKECNEYSISENWRSIAFSVI